MRKVAPDFAQRSSLADEVTGATPCELLMSATQKFHPRLIVSVPAVTIGFCHFLIRFHSARFPVFRAE